MFKGDEWFDKCVILLYYIQSLYEVFLISFFNLSHILPTVWQK